MMINVKDAKALSQTTPAQNPAVHTHQTRTPNSDPVPNRVESKVEAAVKPKVEDTTPKLGFFHRTTHFLGSCRTATTQFLKNQVRKKLETGKNIISGVGTGFRYTGRILWITLCKAMPPLGKGLGNIGDGFTNMLFSLPKFVKALRKHQKLRSVFFYSLSKKVEYGFYAWLSLVKVPYILNPVGRGMLYLLTPFVQVFDFVYLKGVGLILYGTQSFLQLLNLQSNTPQNPRGNVAGNQEEESPATYYLCLLGNGVVLIISYSLLIRILMKSKATDAYVNLCVIHEAQKLNPENKKQLVNAVSKYTVSNPDLSVVEGIQQYVRTEIYGAVEFIFIGARIAAHRIPGLSDSGLSGYGETIQNAYRYGWTVLAKGADNDAIAFRAAGLPTNFINKRALATRNMMCFGKGLNYMLTDYLVKQGVNQYIGSLMAFDGAVSVFESMASNLLSDVYFPIANLQNIEVEVELLEKGKGIDFFQLSRKATSIVLQRTVKIALPIIEESIAQDKLKAPESPSAKENSEKKEEPKNTQDNTKQMNSSEKKEKKDLTQQTSKNPQTPQSPQKSQMLTNLKTPVGETKREVHQPIPNAEKGQSNQTKEQPKIPSPAKEATKKTPEPQQKIPPQKTPDVPAEKPLNEFSVIEQFVNFLKFLTKISDWTDPSIRALFFNVYKKDLIDMLDLIKTWRARGALSLLQLLLRMAPSFKGFNHIRIIAKYLIEVMTDNKIEEFKKFINDQADFATATENMRWREYLSLRAWIDYYFSEKQNPATQAKSVPCVAEPTDEVEAQIFKEISAIYGCGLFDREDVFSQICSHIIKMTRKTDKSKKQEQDVKDVFESFTDEKFEKNNNDEAWLVVDGKILQEAKNAQESLQQKFKRITGGLLLSLQFTHEELKAQAASLKAQAESHSAGSAIRSLTTQAKSVQDTVDQTTGAGVAITLFGGTAALMGGSTGVAVATGIGIFQTVAQNKKVFDMISYCLDDWISRWKPILAHENKESENKGKQEVHEDQLDIVHRFRRIRSYGELPMQGSPLIEKPEDAKSKEGNGSNLPETKKESNQSTDNLAKPKQEPDKTADKLPETKNDSIQNPSNLPETKSDPIQGQNKLIETKNEPTQNPSKLIETKIETKRDLLTKELIKDPAKKSAIKRTKSELILTDMQRRVARSKIKPLKVDAKGSIKENKETSDKTANGTTYGQMMYQYAASLGQSALEGTVALKDGVANQAFALKENVTTSATQMASNVSTWTSNTLTGWSNSIRGKMGWTAQTANGGNQGDNQNNGAGQVNVAQGQTSPVPANVLAKN